MNSAHSIPGLACAEMAATESKRISRFKGSLCLGLVSRTQRLLMKGALLNSPSCTGGRDIDEALVKVIKTGNRRSNDRVT